MSNIMSALFSSALAGVAPNTPATPTPPGSSSTLEGNVGGNGQTPPATGNPTAPVAPGTNGTAAPAGTPAKPESPLDKFSSLWEPVKQDTSTPPNFGDIDPAKIAEMANQMDFTKMISADTLAKISAGGAEAAAAFSDAMKTVSSGAFAQSTIVATKLIDKALQQQAASFQKQLPTLVRQAQLHDGMRTENPVLAHPAAKPLTEALQRQLAAKYPDATAQDLTAMAQEFLVSFAGDLTKGGKTEEVANKGKPAQAVDWSTFLPDYLN